MAAEQVEILTLLPLPTKEYHTSDPYASVVAFTVEPIRGGEPIKIDWEVEHMSLYGSLDAGGGQTQGNWGVSKRNLAC